MRHLERFGRILALLALITAHSPSVGAASQAGQVQFRDDFGGDLSGWELVGAHAVRIRDSGDPEHGRVLELAPDGAVAALVKGSDQWGPLRIEADVLFPDDQHNYLGLVYHYTRGDTRTDFGSVYIKGNGSYIRVNPWRDGNASRLLYEEYKTPLRGDDAIRTNEWHRVKAEILGNVCHFYVGDMATPKVTFGLLELSSGLVGFKPRVVGGPVLVDNVEITSIDRLSYGGPDRPAVVYEPRALLTDWEVIGPLAGPVVGIERSGDASQREITAGGVKYSWRPFEVDPRGAVVTGKVTEYSGGRPVAYFRTVIHAPAEEIVTLHITTLDELAISVNGRFRGFLYRDGYVSGENDWNAWYDFWKNPAHAGRRMEVALRPGPNQIVVRVYNGQFASGGFFAYLERPEARK